MSSPLIERPNGGGIGIGTGYSTRTGGSTAGARPSPNPSNANSFSPLDPPSTSHRGGNLVNRSRGGGPDDDELNGGNNNGGGNGFWAPGRATSYSSSSADVGHAANAADFFRRPSYDTGARSANGHSSVEDPAMSAVRDALGGVVPYYGDPHPQTSGGAAHSQVRDLDEFGFDHGPPSHLQQLGGVELGFGDQQVPPSGESKRGKQRGKSGGGKSRKQDRNRAPLSPTFAAINGLDLDAAPLALDPGISDAHRIDGLFDDSHSGSAYQGYRQDSFSVEAPPTAPHPQEGLAETLTKLQTLLPQPTDPTGPVDHPIVSINEFEHAIVITSSRYFQDLADVLHRTSSDLIQHGLHQSGKLNAVADILTETKRALNHLLFVGGPQFSNHISLDGGAFGDHFGPPGTATSTDHPTYNQIDDLVQGIRPNSSHGPLHDAGFNSGGPIPLETPSLRDGGMAHHRPPLHGSESYFDAGSAVSDPAFPPGGFGGQGAQMYPAGSGLDHVNGHRHLPGGDVYDVVHQTVSPVSPGLYSEQQTDGGPSGRQMNRASAARPRTTSAGATPSSPKTNKASKRKMKSEEAQENGSNSNKKKRVVHGPWKEAEGERLKELAAESKGRNPKLPPDEVDWDYVVDKFGKSRSRHQILIKAVYLGIRPTTTHSSRLVRQKQYRGRETDIAGLSEEKRAQYIAERDAEERARIARGEPPTEYDDEMSELSEVQSGRDDRKTSMYGSHQPQQHQQQQQQQQHESSFRTAMDPYLPAASNVRGSSESST